MVRSDIHVTTVDEPEIYVSVSVDTGIEVDMKPTLDTAATFTV